MKEVNNKCLVDLINEILEDSGDTIPEDLRETLKDYLADANLICPVDNNGPIILNIGPRILIPASCDIDDFKRIFKDERPELFEFGELSKHLTYPIDGIMINPGSFGFIIEERLARMVFNRINDKDRAPVRKGYDVKVRLNDLRPLHWKDLIIPENITFYELDDILKTLWGFNGYHLSMFFLKKEDITIADETVAHACMMEEYLDSKTTMINEFFEKSSKITYWYDFGDDWYFDIEIKKTVDYDRNYVTIKRFKGKYDPIEDCGGVWALGEIICLEENPDEGDDYFEDYLDYLDEFDMDYVQERLKDKDYVSRLYE